MPSATSRIRGFPLRTIEADSTLAAFTFGTASSLSFSVLQLSAGPLQNEPLTIAYHAHDAIMLGKIRYIPESFKPGPSISSSSPSHSICSRQLPQEALPGLTSRTQDSYRHSAQAAPPARSSSPLNILAQILHLGFLAELSADYRTPLLRLFRKSPGQTLGHRCPDKALLSYGSLLQSSSWKATSAPSASARGLYQPQKRRSGGLRVAVMQRALGYSRPSALSPLGDLQASPLRARPPSTGPPSKALRLCLLRQGLLRAGPPSCRASFSRPQC
jgi:hypothetical protein